MTILLWMSMMLSAPMFSTDVKNTGVIIVNLNTPEEPRGDVHIAVFDSEAHFMQTEKRIAGIAVPVKSAEAAEIQVGRLPYGSYAIAVFQDLNNNGKLDKNTLGIPTEPYAFSNNPTAKWRPATFRETRFELRQPQLTLDIALKFWKDH